MNTVFIVLTILIIIASLLLIAVVLLQNGKGDGLASNFVAGNQAFGVRQTADLLEKITWGLVAFILLVAIISSFTLRPASENIVPTTETEVVESAPEFPGAEAAQTNPVAESE